MAKRIAKQITDKDILNDLLNVNEEDITLSYIMEMFGEFDGKSRVNPYDIIDIPPNTYGIDGKKNKNKFTTTAGIWIFNKFFIEKELFNTIGYYNDNINSKSFNDINKILSYALLEDDIELSVLKNFLNKQQKFMAYCTAISTHMTEKMLLSSEVNNKEKEKLIKQYKKELEEGNGAITEQIEKQLIEFAKDNLKDDPSADSFNSGARGSWGNNYKNMFIMKGAIKDPDPEKSGYTIVTDNYIDGISKENYSTIANSLTEGPYARGKKTAIGGYWEKQFINAFQHITLDKPNSDCGSTKYLTIRLNNPDLWMYSYIVEGNSLVELTSKNVNKYKGKTVKIRYSSLCKSKTGICNKCAGNFFYRLGIINIGASTPMIPSKLKLLSMKSFHNSVQKFTEMDPMKAFGFK